MPITHAELLEKLKPLEVELHVPPDQSTDVLLELETERYVNADGRKALFIVCRIHENGASLEVFAPAAYSLRDCRHKGALFAALMQVCLRTKFLQAEYDPERSEVHFSMDLPIEDATVTARQLGRMVVSLGRIVDDFDPVVRHAYASGKIDMSLLPGRPPEAPAGLLELLEELGGMEELQRIVAERRSKGPSA